MASIVSAGTTSATALNMSADTSGVLQLASNNGTVGLTMSTSQNIGIGTASPVAKLDVQGILAVSNSGSSYWAFDRDNSSGSLTIGDTGTQRMELNTSGNLGLGVTPSAWGAPLGGALQVGNASLARNSGGATLYLNSNAYYDGSNWRYINTGFSAKYTVNNNNGQHFWDTAASGTAGNAITFTQAMTLTASGNLGIGNTSPDSKLVVEGGSGTYVQVKDGTVNTFIQARSANSSGVVGTITNHALAFYTNSTEKARIDSSGKLLVGTTSSVGSAGIGQFVQTATGSAGAAISAEASDSAFTYSVLYLNTNRSASTGFQFITCTTSNYGSNRFIVYGNGDTVNANNSYGGISDIKLKENIVDATPKLAGLMQVKVRNYNLKSDPDHKQLGVIAQELETVFPSMIDETVDKDAEGNELGTTTKSVKYSVFVPMLIKAIQEQQAIIDQLKADVTALKGAA